jgi:hypothetical protein
LLLGSIVRLSKLETFQICTAEELQTYVESKKEEVFNAGDIAFGMGLILFGAALVMYLSGKKD